MRSPLTLITAVFLLISAAAHAQYQTATLSAATSGASSSIVVPTGKVCEVVSFAKTYTTGIAKLEYFGLLLQVNVSVAGPTTKNDFGSVDVP